MNITDIIKLISLILAISLAGERLVTLLKTVFPWLSGSQPPIAPPDPKTDNTRKAIVMIIAFLASWVTAAFLGGTPFSLFKTIDMAPPINGIPVVILGVFASGGSAFWTSLLGYFTALKDIKVEQKFQERLQSKKLADSEA